ncbi:MULTISPECIES: hypothetical protein [unclassified Neptuniibacter]|uniref:hypothetical protein n=1 Tax=unclassified Neptuniibacter TaxID=2630693 RepID=UPI0025F24AD5|nr:MULTISPECIES: hypothetical protein [unclassified Neptuniibacter]
MSIVTSPDKLKITPLPASAWSVFSSGEACITEADHTPCTNVDSGGLGFDIKS